MSPAAIAAATPLPTLTPVPGLVDGTFDLGGYRVFLTCQGVGSPTVVLVHGSGGTANDWRTIPQQVATFTRVCSYTRPPAGVGPQPRTSQTSVDELHTLLAMVEIAGPYILVGHSWGGGLVRLYAQQYPAEVAGVVLIDSVVEQLEANPQAEAFATAAATRNEPWAQEYRAAREAWADPRTTFEGVDLDVSIAQVRAIASLGALPLGVVSAGHVERRPAWPPEFLELFWRRHQEVQHTLVGLSTSMRRVQRSLSVRLTSRAV